MPATTSSKPARISKPSASPRWGRAVLETAAVACLFAVLSAAFVSFCLQRGWLLYYGDATAHLNIARRLIDSRTPGWNQLGTVWLPLPHLLMVPFVRDVNWWSNGVAGAVPAAVCFVLAGVFFFCAARRSFRSAAAGAAACALLALNPNLLYLSSIPMTEAFLLVSIAAALYFTVLYRDTQSLWAAAAAGIAVAAGTLTRYEAWFVIPFAAAYLAIAGRRRRVLPALLFGAIACLGPLYWLAHNWWYYGNFLEFYNGPYSAKAIYQRALDAHMARYPGDGNWPAAWLYFRTAVRLSAGAPLVWLGLGGGAAALLKRAWWPVLFLALPPIFYLWSLHSSATPIFVPQLWPHSWYNTRYGLAALPLLAFAAAALVALVPARFRTIAAILVVLAAAAPWALYPRPENWICWKESQVNSEARRAWTRQAADYLRARYRPGDGILTSFGDLTGIYQQARIPLRETLHEGNDPQWTLALFQPAIFLWERWAVAISGDKISTALARTRKSSPRYDLVETIAVKGAPVIEIYRRSE